MIKRLFRNRRLCCLVILTLLTLAVRAKAIQPYVPVEGDPLLEPWRCQLFPELSGLGLRCMLEAPDHSIWFGTDSGIRRYDGLEWQSMDSEQGLRGSVEALCKGADGSIYAAGPGGIRRFYHGQWSPVLRFEKKLSGSIHSLTLARDGSLWAATSWGALHVQSGTLQLYTDSVGATQAVHNLTVPPLQVQLLPAAICNHPEAREASSGSRFQIYEVYEDSRSRVWLSLEQGELLCYNAGLSNPTTGPWTLYNDKDGLICFQWPHVLELTNGQICAVSYSAYGRVNYFDGATWRRERLTDYGGSDDFSSLLQTRDGVLWLGCNGALCACRQGTWTAYYPPKLPIPCVRTLLMQSSDGALWIAGLEADAMRIDYQTPRWLTYQNLNFQWQSPEGAQWFLERSGRIVCHRHDQWLSYGVEDGLIDSPVALLGTRTGAIWVVGSHEHVAATACFDGRNWQRTVLENLSWGVDGRAVLEAADGSLWFGAAVDSSGLGRHYDGGIVQYTQGRWVHHAIDTKHVLADGQETNKPLDHDSLGKFYGIAQSRDGRIWAGLYHLTYYDGRHWHLVAPSLDARVGTIETLVGARDGSLWVGSRQHGIFHFDGKDWQRFHAPNGLTANTVRAMDQAADGTLWAATDRGISHFDGAAWTAEVLPQEFNMSREGGSLKNTASGALWINHAPRNWRRRAWPKSGPLNLNAIEFWTVRHQIAPEPPKAYITQGLTNVAHPGNLVLSWRGVDSWRRTPSPQLQYSFRMDAGPWSPYGSELNHSFLGLGSGPHRFELRTRNRDFVSSPTPAVLEFQVTPPVWKQPWFLVLILLLGGTVITQTVREILKAQHLRHTNLQLAAQIEECKRIEAEVETTHKQLLLASHQAGMAEVATSVLHNVGNVLNSINVSVNLLSQKITGAKLDTLPKLAQLLTDHAQEPLFLSKDAKGTQIPSYLIRLGTHLANEQKEELNELHSLHQNIEHIREIITVQQASAKLMGLVEPIAVAELVDSALRLTSGGLSRRHIALERDLQPGLSVVAEKHKILQILINLIRNAEHACEESSTSEKRLTLRTRAPAPGWVQLQVQDNGVGISAENLTKIFAQGFTTRKTGHGFGLHSAANTAKQLGGTLSAHSDGPGKGATFILEIPTQKPAEPEPAQASGAASSSDPAQPIH